MLFTAVLKVDDLFDDVLEIRNVKDVFEARDAVEKWVLDEYPFLKVKVLALKPNSLGGICGDEEDDAQEADC